MLFKYCILIMQQCFIKLMAANAFIKSVRLKNLYTRSNQYNSNFTTILQLLKMWGSLMLSMN